MAIEVEQHGHLHDQNGRTGIHPVLLHGLLAHHRRRHRCGAQRPATTAMVLTGDGRFFSAGADINAFLEAIDSNTAPELTRNLTGVLHLLMRIRTSSTIVVAAPTAFPPAVALGWRWPAMLAPAPLTLDGSILCGHGLSPDGGTTWLLPRLVGEQRARRFFMGNEIWSGEEAHQFGAIDVLVDPASLLETAMGLAKMWSSWGPHTKEATKHLLHVQTDNDFATHLDHERTLIEAAGTTEAFREGVAAFLEKRPPSFN